MTISYSCDGCGKTLADGENVVDNRPTSSKLYLSSKTRGQSGFCVEIITGVSGTWNQGELCKSCLLKLIKQLLEIEA